MKCTLITIRGSAPPIPTPLQWTSEPKGERLEQLRREQEQFERDFERAREQFKRDFEREREQREQLKRECELMCEFEHDRLKVLYELLEKLDYEFERQEREERRAVTAQLRSTGVSLPITAWSAIISLLKAMRTQGLTAALLELLLVLSRSDVVLWSLLANQFAELLIQVWSHPSQSTQADFPLELIECSVCLDKLHQPVEVVHNGSSHAFCASCLQEWFNERELQGLTIICPCCNAPIEDVNTNPVMLRCIVEYYRPADPTRRVLSKDELKALRERAAQAQVQPPVQDGIQVQVQHGDWPVWLEFYRYIVMVVIIAYLLHRYYYS